MHSLQWKKRLMELNAVSSPNPNLLAPKTLGFLAQHFKSTHDLDSAANLFTDLSTQCAELETHLRNLHSKLTKSLISWSSLCIRAKSSLQDFVENLAAMTSQCGNEDCWEREMEVMLTEELPYIAREVQRISDVREYAEIALKLESLVGDLEDSVLSVLKGQTGALCSKAPLNPPEFDAKQETIHQAVSAIMNIEDVLCQVVKSHPRWSHLLKAVDSRVDESVSSESSSSCGS
ncbi:RINT1-like protein [Drosera capensis]